MRIRARRTFLVLTLLASVDAAVAQTQQVEVFQQELQHYVRDTGLPVTLEAVTVQSYVTEANLPQRAAEVVRAMAMFNRGEIQKLTTAEIDGDAVAAAIQSFQESRLISPGDALVLVRWKGKSTFETIATMDRFSRPKFEPLLYFFQSLHEDDQPPHQGSWVWGPQRRVLQNGLHMQCATVVWRVALKCSPDHCKIEDPPPHVELGQQGSNCWLWEQKTTKGETPFCSSFKSCKCSANDRPDREDCIKWAVVTYVATGFSDIIVNTEAAGDLKGVKPRTSEEHDR